MRKVWLAVLLSLVGLGISFKPVFSESDGDTGTRIQVEDDSGFAYHYQLKNWEDNVAICDIYVDHSGQPNEEEISGFCGDDAYTIWLATPPCDTAWLQGVSDSCTGTYLVYVGYSNLTHPEIKFLPAAQANFEIVECDAGVWCAAKQKLRVSGVEPLSDYQIEEVHITVDGKALTCRNRDTCDYPLPLTDYDGISVEFWVNSTFGDSSAHRTLRLRQIHRNQSGGQYRVDVISPETTDIDAIVTWDVYPSVDDPYESFYSAVESPADLTTHYQLYYLAGKLISTNEIDGSSCPGYGLLSNGMANTCGMDLTLAAINTRQNQYNQQIYDAAKANQMPAMMIKGIIAQESQFWTDAGETYEYGMGSLSENGIDVLLSWDLDRFLGMCQPLYGDDECEAGYDSMDAKAQAYMRGLILRDIGGDQEIALITETLKAYSVQMGQTVENITGSPAGQVASYESLWDLTLASYHAGIGCVSDGLVSLQINSEAITFDNFCTVNQSCPNACEYVEKVKNYAFDRNLAASN